MARWRPGTTGLRQPVNRPAPLPTGVTLRYAVQGDSAGPAVILLHGYSDSWFSFSRVLPLLPPGYRVYALDQRGHGDSEKPAGGYGMKDLAADALAFMDAYGIRRAVVVGHSMGSLVAQQVAAAAPDRVAGLVLIGSGPSVRYFPGTADLANVVHSFTDSVPGDFVREFQLSTVYLPLPDSFLSGVVAESRKLPPHVWQGIADGMIGTAEARALGGTQIPALVLWGDRDQIFDRVAQDSLVAMIPGAELKVFPETGHAPHWERPEAAAADLAAFLGRVAPVE